MTAPLNVLFLCTRNSARLPSPPINLPMASLNRLALTHKLQDIGRIEGSTSKYPKVA